MTPLDQLRLRLPAHEFDRLMQAAKPVADMHAQPLFLKGPKLSQIKRDHA